jgi:phosphoribosylanthranilate isomerase
MTKIKICGIMRECDCDCLNEFLPDYAGFIFVEGRRRCISPETAAKFREKLDKRIKTVGVFLDDDIERIGGIADMGIIDMIQLHGQETDEYIAKVKERTGLPVMKAFTVRGIADVNTALHSSADMLLMDNGAGTGEMFDHELIEEADRLFFLAGGLGPDNVGAAVERYCPYGVDVSTGVETDGHKDYDKIKRFIEAVRKAGTF